MFNVPFATFTGYLKGIRTDDLSTEQRVAQRLAFPGFFAEPARNPKDVEEYKRRKLGAQGIRVELQEPFGYRRFAGGAELPRSRYYSICADKTGNDHQTLASELMAYIEPKQSGEVYALDLSDPAYSELREHYIKLWPEAGTFNDVIAALFRSRPGCPTPFVEKRSAAIGKPTTPLVEVTAVLPVFFPTHTYRESIPCCIDLRLPEVQKWFNSEIRTGIPGLAYLYGDVGIRKELLLTEIERSRVAGEVSAVSLQDLDTKVDKVIRWPPNPGGPEILSKGDGSFVDLLPLFMFPLKGGSPITDAIAVWLRRLGANALIFPSARTDPYCKIQNGKLVETRGWNLVDYRNAPQPPSLIRLIEEPVTWIIFRHNLTINQGVTGGPYEGSWHIEGNYGAELSRVKYESELYYQEKYLEESKSAFERTLFYYKEENWDGPVSIAEIKASLSAGLILMSIAVARSQEAALTDDNLTVGEAIAQTIIPKENSFLEGCVVWTGSWFIHQWGADAEALVHCPVCDFSTLWQYLRVYPQTACPTCGFSNGTPEDRDVIRSRIIKQDEDREAEK